MKYHSDYITDYCKHGAGVLDLTLKQMFLSRTSPLNQSVWLLMPRTCYSETSYIKSLGPSAQRRLATGPLHSRQSHFFGATPKTTGRTPGAHDPICYLPHIEVAFLWHITFSNTKSNTSQRRKLVIKHFTTLTPPATGFQIQKLVMSLKHQSEVFKYNCYILPEESRMKKYWKSQLQLPETFHVFKKNLKEAIA